MSRCQAISLLLTFFVLCSLFCGSGFTPIASAQSLAPLLGALAGQSKSPTPAPSVTSVSSSSLVSHAPVVFNDQTLFELSNTGGRSASDRADLASLRLADALRALPKNGEITAPSITVDTEGADPVLRLNGQTVLTVTAADASAANESAPQLASSWADIIQQIFAQTLRERQPPYLHWAIRQSLILIIIGILVHLLVWIVARRWLDKPGWPIQLLIWIWIVRLTLDLFPQTRPVNNALWNGALRPLTLFLIVALIAAVLVRLWVLSLGRLFPSLPEHLSAEERTERTFSRRATLGDVARVTGATMIWIIAFLVALTWIGVNLPALLTSAGLLGVAISLAFQDSLKDLVAGINILADDRFGVGDTVSIGTYQGSVERITLRITQIRDSEGRLITIPNRNIQEVANLTARWAQVDFKVGVSYYDDLHKAMQILETTVGEYAKEHPEHALEPPQMLGVDSFNDENIILRLLLRTPPGDQWTVARELRRRVKEAYDNAGIAFLNSQYAVSTPVPKHDVGGEGAL
jgi:small-conductance mechanosensitive channel